MHLENIWECFDFKKQCLKYGTKIWQCPQFLFLAMGLVIITAILVTNKVGQKYADPLIVALIVLGITVFLMIISYTIISSFDRIAQASYAKSEFIRIMSHQLRTPLSAIKWQMELLLNKKINPDKESIDQALQEINEKNHKMIWVVNNFLDVSFVEDNNLVLMPAEFSLRPILDEVIDSLQDSAKRANIKLFVTAPQDLPNAYADANKIKNILFHLIDNAIRYSDKQGYVTVTLETLPGQVRCSVSDEGIGISQSDLKNVFKKFFRADNPLGIHISGTGIGLFLAKIIIERSGGSIGFNSVHGKGSTFWFTLPAAVNANKLIS